MAQTKMIARIVSDQRRRQFQRMQAAPPCKWVRSGVKNSEGRVRNKTFKIKQFIAVPKNIQVKKNGQVVQRMTVHGTAIFPAEHRHTEY